MSAVIRVETFILTVPRSTPYLGPLGAGERVNGRGYLVRRGNGTLYPTVDRSVLVRDCSSWPRLDGCMRVTIGTPAEDDAFLAALEDAL